MDVSAGVKTNVKTTNGMIRPDTFRVIAGPCTVESYEQFVASAKAVRQAGFDYVRGGAFKPRTSPYSFQGLGEEGLKILSEVSGDLGLKVVTEVMDPYDIEMVMEHAEILQIGARNMANFSLLRRVGGAISGTDHGVVLKRDLSAVIVAKRLTDLPVIVDPSHAAGRRDLVVPLSKAAVAAEADGLMVESHHDPREALCDGEQALPVKALLGLKEALQPFAGAMGREVI